MGLSTSGVKQLYINTTPLPQGSTNSFPISYASPKTSNLKVLVGLSGYEEHSDMSLSYLKISIGVNTLSQFAVSVVAAGSCFINILAVSYLALEDTISAYYTLQLPYNAFVILKISRQS